MNVFKRFGFWLFAIVAIADVALVARELDQYRIYTKPLLMPLLLAAILGHTGFKKHPTSKLLIAGALAAATLGDILLLNTEKNIQYFAYGLASFLVMQVLYLVYFVRVQPFRKHHLISSIVLATLLYAGCFFMLRFLFPYLGELAVAVIIYSFVIALMLLAAANIFHSHKFQKLAIRFFIPGAVFILLSDGILAVNKFYLNDNMLDVAVMVSYLTGQLLLAIGFTKHLKPRRSSRRTNTQRSEEEMLLLD